MAIDYGIEKFQRAVDALADSVAPWKDRLFSAFLCMHTVRPEEDLPPEFASRGAALFEAMTRVRAKGTEGDIRATINAMDEREGGEIVHEIWSINDQLSARFRH